MEEKGTSSLVRLLDLDDDFIIDLRYATENNFTGQKVYDSEECYINGETAKLLIAAKNRFKADGYRVKIWDAYRPVSVQKKFWEIMPETPFVGRPPDMTQVTEFRARHINGMSVDVTLTDMDGKEIEMPSEFDEFDSNAILAMDDPESPGVRNALYLQKIMVECGFSPYENEWWHFDDDTNVPTPYLDERF